MTRRAGIVWTVALWGACQDLEELELGRCGNGVLETGEDCDTYAQAPGGELCIAAGSLGQCRYSCGEAENGDRFACPGGYGCGIDGICRRHSGANDAVNATGQPAGTWIGAGDVDGDGSDDVINLYSTQLTVDFMENGAYRQSHRLPLEARGLPIVDHLDADALTDVAVPTKLGLAVWRGSSARVLLPTTYASLPIEISAFEFVASDVVPDVPEPVLDPLVLFPGDEPLTLTEFGAFNLRRNLTYGVAFEDVFNLGFVFPVAHAIARPLSARFDETADVHGAYVESPEQMVLAIDSPHRIYLYRPSYFVQDEGEGPRFYYFANAPTEAASGDPPVPPSHPAYTTITPPPGMELVAGPIVANVNKEGAVAGFSSFSCGVEMAIADDHLDLIVRGLVAGAKRTAVAFGVGDGTFHGDPCELDEVIATTVVADNEASVPTSWASCDEIPLAAGDIDDDGGLDFVTVSAVLLSGRIPAALTDMFGICDDIARVPHPDGDGGWRDAAIGDFNGDGLADVIAANEAGGIDLLTSARGSLLNHARIATSTQASLFTLGDFDGNGVHDVAFGEVREGGEDLLYMVFGEQGALPAEPVLFGGLPELTHFTAMNLAQPDAPAVDGISNLGVGTRDPDNENIRYAIIYGRADRQLQAPFVLAIDAQLNEPATERYTPVAVTTASFGMGCGDGSEPGRALVMTGWARAEFVTPFPAPDTVLGAACIGDDADLDPLGSDEYGLPFGKDRVQNTAAAAVRLTGAQPEPILIAWQDDFAGGVVSIDIAAPQPIGAGSDLTWEPGMLASIADAVPVHTPGPEPGSRLWRWSPALSNRGIACRLGPGEEESLVFLAMHLDGACGDRTKARTVLHVIPAAVLEGIRGGGSLAGEETISGEGAETILGFACLNADEDPAEEIAFVTLDGPDEQCGDSFAQPRHATVHIVQAGADGRLEPRRTYFQLSGVHVPYLDEPHDDRPPISGLARGDFNGDGVDDLALAAFPSTLALLGRPVNR